MKKIAFFLLIIGVQFNFAQISGNNFPQKVDSLISVYLGDKTIASMEIYSLTDRELFYERNSNLLLRPASNMKILTSATGLFFLGPDYKFTTKLYSDGRIEDDKLNGNIYIKGGFDPDFTSENLDEFVQAVLDLGITTINGNIYGDVSLGDSKFWGQGWMWDDDPGTDFPYMTALNINDDAVLIELKPSDVGEKAVVNILPHSLMYTFENNLLTDTLESNYKVTRDWVHRKNHFVIEGTINVNDNPDTSRVNLVSTHLYAATLLKESLYREGVLTLGIVDTMQTPENANFIEEYQRPYSEVIVNLNKTSDNLSAEMTLRALGSLVKPSNISARDGVMLVDSLIKLVGKNPEDFRIVDGSGVSHYNLISTSLINSFLKYFYFNEPALYELLRDSFPIAGKDGTLKYRMKEGKAFENVHAKTGTLSGVSSLSGYVADANNKLYSFSIMVQNFVGSARNARKFQDEICELIAGMEK